MQSATEMETCWNNLKSKCLLCFQFSYKLIYFFILNRWRNGFFLSYVFGIYRADEGNCDLVMARNISVWLRSTCMARKCIAMDSIMRTDLLLCLFTIYLFHFGIQFTFATHHHEIIASPWESMLSLHNIYHFSCGCMLFLLFTQSISQSKSVEQSFCSTFQVKYTFNKAKLFAGCNWIES